MCSNQAAAPVGGAITLDVALKVLIVKSANDVAVMIARRSPAASRLSSRA
jgi:D-alanyl-D-alanine carboxypeptidase